MSELKVLVARRGTVRAKVTTCYNHRSDYVNYTSLQQIAEKATLTQCKDDLENFDECYQQKKFLGETINETELNAEVQSCYEYTVKIQECLAILNSLTQGTHPVGHLDIARSLLRQPTAPLPKFAGGEDEDLCKFLKEFELTTSSYKYPDRDLLLLLMQQVSGNARTLLNSLEADKQTYQSAKDLLTAAFASEEKRKFASISKLTELNLGYNDDPYAYISKVKMISESVKSLSINSDDFLQYFVWKGLNKSFQTHLRQITTKTLPNLQEIVDSFFDANERYQQSQKSVKKKVCKSEIDASKDKKSST